MELARSRRDNGAHPCLQYSLKKGVKTKLRQALGTGRTEELYRVKQADYAGPRETVSQTAAQRALRSRTDIT